MNVAIISDVHGNIQALKAVLSDMNSLNITKIIFLGDLVINGPSPIETLEEMEKIRLMCWIKGNTDDWFAEINEEWSPSTQQEEKLFQLFLYARKHLNNESIAFLLNCPEKCSLEIEGVTILAVHGSPRSYSEGIGKNLGQNELKTIFSDVQESVIVSGHTHIPYIGKVGRKTIFNVGSVGMPIDGDNRAAYGVLKIIKGIPECSIRRIRYPIDETLATAQEQGFPDLENYKKKLRKAKI